MSTWIAVAFDIVDKMRELALADDAAGQSGLDNNQVTGSFWLPRVLDSFERANKIEDELRPLLEEVRAAIAATL